MLDIASRRPAAKRRLLQILRTVLAFVFPDECVSCGTPLEPAERHVCGACRSRVRLSGQHLTLARPVPEDPGFEAAPLSAICALEFSGVARDMIHCLKYQGRASLARTLVEMSRPVLAARKIETPDIVVAVPLHRTRLRERGFNQSELLAQHISGVLGAPAVRPIKRTRPTSSQATLPRKERYANVEGAFSRLPGARCTGLRILLVDDVVTTGATMSSAAAALLAAGAASVSCFAIAGPAAGAVPERVNGAGRDAAPAHEGERRRGRGETG